MEFPDTKIQNITDMHSYAGEDMDKEEKRKLGELKKFRVKAETTLVKEVDEIYECKDENEAEEMFEKEHGFDGYNYEIIEVEELS